MEYKPWSIAFEERLTYSPYRSGKDCNTKCKSNFQLFYIDAGDLRKDFIIYYASEKRSVRLQSYYTALVN